MTTAITRHHTTGHSGATGHSATARRPSAHRPPGAPLPPHIWFADRLLGILTGRRPIACLAGLINEADYDRLWDLTNTRADWRHRTRGHLPALRRCRWSAAGDGALEVTAVVALTRDCVRAIAFRLERAAGIGHPPSSVRGWTCTAIAAVE
jgi:hypothetical protein